MVRRPIATGSARASRRRCTRRTSELIEIHTCASRAKFGRHPAWWSTRWTLHTKSHVNTFHHHGDSDFFAAGVQAARERQQVIGVGRSSPHPTCLIANCDEFIFYDDLVRENQRAQPAARALDNSAPAPRRSPEEGTMQPQVKVSRSRAAAGR